jgi:hypothetical protein
VFGARLLADDADDADDAEVGEVGEVGEASTELGAATTPAIMTEAARIRPRGRE